jgi:hypothetical protein
MQMLLYFPRAVIVGTGLLAALGFLAARSAKLWNLIMSTTLATSGSVFLSTSETLWLV